MLRVLIGFSLIFLCGCSSLRNEIKFTDDGVRFNMRRSGKLYFKNKEKEVYFDCKSGSILRDIVDVSMIKAVGDLNEDD